MATSRDSTNQPEPEPAVSLSSTWTVSCCGTSTTWPSRPHLALCIVASSARSAHRAPGSSELVPVDYRCEERLFIASNREQVGAQLWCDGAAAGRHREQPYAAADAPKGGAEVAGPWALGFLWVTQGGPIPPRHIVGDGGDQSIWRIFWSCPRRTTRTRRTRCPLGGACREQNRSYVALHPPCAYRQITIRGVK